MIRDAHLLDIPRLLELAGSYQKEIEEGNNFVPEFDLEIAAINISNTIVSDTGFAKVLVIDGKVVGFIWGLVFPPVPWSTHLCADCLLFYIEPTHRGGYSAYALFRAYKRWAELQDCREIRISTASGILTELTEKLFMHLGFKMLGSVYHIHKE